MRLRAVAVAVCAVWGLSTSASAQSIQWGLWGEPPERSSKAMLGAPPALKAPSDLLQGGARPAISAKAPQTVSFPNTFKDGSIIIDTAGRKLYYTLSSSAAYVYPIAVGKEGFTWTGVENVSRIVDWPDWIPPAEMRQRKPGLPLRMTGGLNNPLGARAIYLGNTLYRIHGTNDASSIGSAASSGCIRMHNEHVVHLAGLVNSNTTVFVMKRLPKGGTISPPTGWQPAPPAEAAPLETERPAPAQPPADAAPVEAPAPPADQKI